MDLSEPYLCSRCGYNLTGLPEVGKCPECGNPYNTRAMVGVKIVEPGYSRGQRLARRIRTIIFAALAVGVLGCGGLLTLLMSVLAAKGQAISAHPTKPLWICGFLALAFVLAAITSYVYEKD